MYPRTGAFVKIPTRIFIRSFAVVWLAFAGLLPAQATARTAATPPPASLTVFLDCGMCDEDYIRTEIKYVNWVRDRTAADVHVLITRESTGGGGTQFTAAFLGANAF